jgi:predicted Kef-type K+ transport protein
LFGCITHRLGLSTLVGYLLAGIAVGPHTPGFVADRGIAAQFAEIGVILLMFGVGMHFHPRDLLRVTRDGERHAEHQACAIAPAERARCVPARDRGHRALRDRAGNRDPLVTVAVFVVALGVALIAAQVFHLSVALGAFFAGLVVGQSRFGPQASLHVAPFRDVFSALFFVSVGMLFDPALVLAEPIKVLIALGIVLVVKPLVALAIVLLLRDTRKTAATVAIGLAQIGEFSFILGALGTQLGVLPAEALDALIAAALVSIAVNPLLFKALAWFARRAEHAPALQPTPSTVRPGRGANALPRVHAGRTMTNA